MLKVEEINSKLLNTLFSSNVVPRIRLNDTRYFRDKFTQKELKQFKKIVENKVAVLGFDIYKYSVYSAETQPFIPHLFDLIYNQAWELITQNFDFLFQHYRSISSPSAEINPRDYFINTGDGGFQLFETPLHAVIFVLVFETILRLYNSGLFMRKLHAKIDNITIRYALTLDNVYKYNKNFYGASIINNSRIMGRDQLNRFLLDDNSYKWFLQSIIGIENLMSITLSDLTSIKEFKSYDKKKIKFGRNALIHSGSSADSREGIKSVDVQKIGTIKSKQTVLEIYNLHLQAVIHYVNFVKQSKVFTISVGNLNTDGLAYKT